MSATAVVELRPEGLNSTY